MKNTTHQSKTENFFNKFKKALDSRRVDEEALAKQKVNHDILTIISSNNVSQLH